jgi:hypothetical protein
MIPSCDFDAGPGKVSDCSQECYSTGCGQYQLGNGSCDEICNFQECGWDAGDCLCGDFCQTSKLNNKACDLECLVPNCSYDTSDCSALDTPNTNFLTNATKRWQAMQKDFSVGYDIEVCLAVSPSCLSIGDGICDSTCNRYECLYDWDDCYSCELNCKLCVKGKCLDCPGELRLYDECVAECPVSHAPHSIYTNLCYPKLDTSSMMSPYEIYVKSSSSSSIENGSLSHPYTTLSDAFANILATHTIIYLLSSIDLKPSSSTLYSSDPKKPLSLSISYSTLTISTYICSHDIHCLSSPATILVKDSSIQLEFQSNAQIKIKDVIWDASEGLVEGCKEWYCKYCPYYIVSASGLVFDDKGNTVDNTLWAKNCNTFHNYNFLTFKEKSEAVIEVRNI